MRISIHIALVLVGGLSSGLRGQDLHASASPSDTTALLTTLRAVVGNAGKTPVYVDPRPLRSNPPAGEVSTTTIMEVAPAVSEVRRRTAQELGIEAIDAIRHGQNDSCPGVFVLDRASSRETQPPLKESIHAQCPQRIFYSVALSHPRAGTALLPGDSLYDRAQENPRVGIWAVRVVRTQLGPTGSSVLVSDYLRRCDPRGEWQFVGAVDLMNIH